MWLNAIYANYAASRLPLCVICRVIAGACCLPHGHELVLNCASLLAAQIKQIFADSSSCLFPSLSLWGIGKYGARWIPFRVTVPTIADYMQRWFLSLGSHGYHPSKASINTGTLPVNLKGTCSSESHVLMMSLTHTSHKSKLKFNKKRISGLKSLSL